MGMIVLDNCASIYKDFFFGKDLQFDQFLILLSFSLWGLKFFICKPAFCVDFSLISFGQPSWKDITVFFKRRWLAFKYGMYYVSQDHWYFKVYDIKSTF